MNKLTLNTLIIGSVLLQACSSQVYNNKNYLKQVNLEGKTIGNIAGRSRADRQDA